MPTTEQYRQNENLFKLGEYGGLVGGAVALLSGNVPLAVLGAAVSLVSWFYRNRQS